MFELPAKLLLPFFLSVFILTKQLTGLARRPGKSASSGPIAIVRILLVLLAFFKLRGSQNRKILYTDFFRELMTFELCCRHSNFPGSVKLVQVLDLPAKLLVPFFLSVLF